MGDGITFLSLSEEYVKIKWNEYMYTYGGLWDEHTYKLALFRRT
ncbi:hypothetical protein HNO89_003732 [Sporosarcina luteola]|nr:hypothetical protein [Sporosarcina luteola]